MKTTGRSITEEVYSDVSDRYYLVTSAPLENDLVLITSVDITNLKKAEEELKNSKEEYFRLINTIPDFIVRCDLNGVITLVNDWTLESSGYQREEVIGKNLFSFVAPEDVERAEENVRNMMSGQLGPINYNLVMSDGRKVLFEASGEILRSSDGTATGMIFVGREITERRNGRKGQ
jgi:PAS domain S-box-containing protein